MEAESWSSLFFPTSKRLQSAQQSRHCRISDIYVRFEEIDGGDEPYAEFACPFCPEDFDIIGLCCHINDEHHIESKNGICPICAARVGMDLIGHVIMQHGIWPWDSLTGSYVQRKRRFRRGSSGSRSTLSLLRKELREANLQALLGGLSHSVAPPSETPDPLLSSLICTLPVADSSKNIQPESLDEGSLANKISEEKAVERPCLSDKEQEERACRIEFVRELILSTIFEEVL